MVGLTQQKADSSRLPLSCRHTIMFANILAVSDFPCRQVLFLLSFPFQVLAQNGQREAWWSEMYFPVGWWSLKYQMWGGREFQAVLWKHAFLVIAEAIVDLGSSCLWEIS
jgi:hypothetical protein